MARDQEKSRGNKIASEVGWRELLTNVTRRSTTDLHDADVDSRKAVPELVMIVCADDFGLSDDVDEAILELCSRDRLSAVSCMAALERCSPERLKPLLAHQHKVDVGLHLCVADATVPGLPAFGNFLRRSLTRQIAVGEMCSLAARQYEAFVKKCGRTPDYIDGHLHAHQLPGVRDGLIQFLQSLPSGTPPYIRNTHEPLKRLLSAGLPWMKAAFIGWFGRRMIGELRKAGLPTNDGFAGVYDFRHWQQYPEYFPKFVSCLGDRQGILVVHPGGNEDWRRQEFETLRKFAFDPGTLKRFHRQHPA